MIILTTSKQYYLLSDHSKWKEHGTTTAFGVFFSISYTLRIWQNVSASEHF